MIQLFQMPGEIQVIVLLQRRKKPLLFRLPDAGLLADQILKGELPALLAGQVSFLLSLSARKHLKSLRDQCYNINAAIK